MKLLDSNTPLDGRLFLRFREARLEQDFQEYYASFYFRYVQVALALGGLLLLGDYLVDYLKYPQVGANHYRVLLCLPLLALTLAYTFTSHALRHWQSMMVVLMSVMALALCYVLLLIDEGGGNGLTSGIGLLNLTTLELLFFAIVGVQFRFALPVGSIVLGLFLAGFYRRLGADLAACLYMTYHCVTMFVIAALIGWWREFLIRKEFASWMLAEGEKQKNQDILESMLPQAIVARIKAGENMIADTHGEVTVLFADLQGFTSLASKLGPRHLIEILNSIFSAFDTICEQHHVEKIKTIGDSYMAVSGMRDDTSNHALDAALAGREMIIFLKKFAQQEGLPVGIRVGLHTGPVIAGVLGQKKPQFDLWGDSVNVASRMESNGVEGKVQMSEATWFRTKNALATQRRGEIAIKGKGSVAAYLLDPFI